MTSSAPLPRFGTDGVRGVADSDLTDAVAAALARAAAAELMVTRRRVVIGRDTRASGPRIEAAMIAGFASVGVAVELLGVVPTPVVAAAAADGMAGVMISASHNPYQDNGIKLFAPGGHKLDDDVEAAIEARAHAELLAGGPTDDDGEASRPPSIRPSAAVGRWIEAVTSSIGGRRFDGLRIVVDGAHGSASVFGPQVFELLGADVVAIGAEPDGVNINAGVGSTHPDRLRAEVVASGADLGLAFDGDADRLIAVDEQGGLVDGDHLLAILAIAWHGSGRLHDDTVVVTVMSNLGFRLAMADRGINVVETAVGDRYVLEALERGSGGRRYSLGGEQSGHIICRDLATTGDGVLAAVQVVDAVRSSGSTLSDLAADAMTTYPQILRNVVLPRPGFDTTGLLDDLVAEAEQRLGDRGRLLIRPSGTEPLLRIMVEHLDEATADDVCERLVAAATERLQ